MAFDGEAMSMTFCPGCGAQLLLETQQFCATCGFDLEDLRDRARGAQAGGEIAGPAADVQRTAAAVAPTEPGTPQALPPQPAPPVVSAVAVPPFAPPDRSMPQGAAPRRTSVNPALLVIGGVVIVAIVAVLLVVNGMSGGPGGISFDPSTISCSAPVAFTTTGRLPASVHAGDTVTITLDGQAFTSEQVSPDNSYVQQADGSWTLTNTSSLATVQSLCAVGGSAGGFDVLTPGTHTEQVLDSSGKVLAQGSYTVTAGGAGGAAVTPTPTPTPLATPAPGLTAAQTSAPNAGAFRPTGSLTTAHGIDDTATLLSDGRVLIAGGFGTSGSDLASAELYDPKTGSFSPTGPMTEARLGHTATLLQDGRILIAGGNGTGGSYLASAELYDPKTGTFTPTGPMTTARSGHTTTLLPDGRVLIAGAIGLASAELYDPKTGSFSPTGPMTAARSYHTATLLQDGRVLIAGGIDGTYLASAELYEPQ